jgi:hypothetical protein
MRCDARQRASSTTVCGCNETQCGDVNNFQGGIKVFECSGNVTVIAFASFTEKRNVAAAHRAQRSYVSR